MFYLFIKTVLWVLIRIVRSLGLTDTLPISNRKILCHKRITITPSLAYFLAYLLLSCQPNVAVTSCYVTKLSGT